MICNNNAKSSALREMYDRFEDWALFNEDGSVSHFRVSCLSIVALCLLLHVALKPNADDAASVVQVAQSQSATATNIKVASSNQIMPVQGNSSRGSMTQANSNTKLESINATPSTTAEDVILSKDDSDWEDEEVKSAWYMFGFGAKERKQKQLLAANRKQAVSEIIDGAAFLSACGNINSGYIGCRFSFSDKLKNNFDSTVEAVDDGFMLTLTAKGNQRNDRCTRFIVNSDGVYQAFDNTGALNNKCFGSSIKSSDLLSIRTTEDNLHSSHANSGLAVK